VHIPMIFLTGHGNISMSVRAIKAGRVRVHDEAFRP
jgi:FixJ family two-component response regulator